MIAEYMIIDDISLLELQKLNSNNISEKIEEFAQLDEDFPTCDIDKIWENLHYLLTGNSNPYKVDFENFSEYAKSTFIFGELQNNFECQEYISYIRNKTLKEILPEIEKINFKSLYNNFDIPNFKNAEIYPNIGEKCEKDLIFEEMEMAFEEMKQLFKKALKLGKNILVSIY